MAPRCILKCLCWGDKIHYPNGVIAFSYITPVQDLGMPRGYKSTTAALNACIKEYEDKHNKKKLAKKPGKS